MKLFYGRMLRQHSTKKRTEKLPKQVCLQHEFDELLPIGHKKPYTRHLSTIGKKKHLNQIPTLVDVDK